MSSLEGYLPSTNNLYMRYEKLCQLLNKDVLEINKEASFSDSELDDLKKNSVQPLTIMKLSKYFNITASDFINDQIDYNWLREPTLPEKYTLSRGSRVRTSLPPLNYVRNVIGEKSFNHILNKLKIPRQILQSPDTEVSISLLVDILTEAYELGMSDSAFYMMGYEIIKLSENESLVKGYQGLNKPNQVLEKLFEETMQKFETNFNYKIESLTATSINVEVTAKEIRQEELKSYIIDSPFVSAYRQGGCVGFIQEFCPGFTRAKTLSSVHQGDLTDRFEIRFAV